MHYTQLSDEVSSLFAASHRLLASPGDTNETLISVWGGHRLKGESSGRAPSPARSLLCPWTHHALPVEWTPVAWRWQIRKWVAQQWQWSSSGAAGVSPTAGVRDTDADSRTGAVPREFRRRSLRLSHPLLPSPPPLLLSASQVATAVTNCSFSFFELIFSSIIIFFIWLFFYDWELTAQPAEGSIWRGLSVEEEGSLARSAQATSHYRTRTHKKSPIACIIYIWLAN